MPQGKPATVPDDGLTTRQRRQRPLVVVHTGEMKGKSTAAFGLALRAWNQGWPIGVFQFVKSAKWKTGEESAFRALAQVHARHRPGRAGDLAQDGRGLVLDPAAGHTRPTTRPTPARAGPRSSGTWPPRPTGFYVLDEFTYPMKWGWVDVDDVVATLADRPGQQHVVITGRDADPGSSRPPTWS